MIVMSASQMAQASAAGGKPITITVPGQQGGPPKTVTIQGKPGVSGTSMVMFAQKARRLSDFAFNFYCTFYILGRF